jgi:hypothetical protein
LVHHRGLLVRFHLFNHSFIHSFNPVCTHWTPEDGHLWPKHVVSDQETELHCQWNCDFMYINSIIHLFIYSFIHSSMTLQPLLGPGLFFSFIILTQTVRLTGQVISQLQGCYLHTRQHKHRMHKTSMP